MFNVIDHVKQASVIVSTSAFCLQAHFSLQQSYRQTSGRILQQHPDQEAPAESRTGTRNISFSIHLDLQGAGGRPWSDLLAQSFRIHIAFIDNFLCRCLSVALTNFTDYLDE